MESYCQKVSKKDGSYMQKSTITRRNTHQINKTEQDPYSAFTTLFDFNTFYTFSSLFPSAVFYAHQGDSRTIGKGIQAA